MQRRAAPNLQATVFDQNISIKTTRDEQQLSILREEGKKLSFLEQNEKRRIIFTFETTKKAENQLQGLMTSETENELSSTVQ